MMSAEFKKQSTCCTECFATTREKVEACMRPGCDARWPEHIPQPPELEFGATVTLGVEPLGRGAFQLVNMLPPTEASSELQMARAWMTVHAALCEVSPGWFLGDGTAVQKAVAAIRALAARVQNPASGK